MKVFGEGANRPSDPNCLHCVLGPVIQDFIRLHPSKCGIRTCTELAQVLGELFASELIHTERTHELHRLLVLAMLEARRSALELIDVVKNTSS